MHLTVLIENATLIDRYFRSEPGISFYIEDGDARILFDCGYSDLFLENAVAMGIDPLKVDTVVLSHGHNDHTGGLPALAANLHRAALEDMPYIRPVFITHPATFDRKKGKKGVDVGCPVSQEFLSMFGEVRTSQQPHQITDRLIFLGEIPRIDPARTAQSSAFVQQGGSWVPDPVIEDSCLVYRAEDGLVIICGCTHAGIENTVAHARSVCGDDRISAIIGGLHLYSATPERIEQVSRWSREAGIQALYPCHCTGIAATISLSRHHSITPVGVSSRFSWDE